MTLSRRQLLRHCAAGLGLLALPGCGRRDRGELVDALVELAVTRDSMAAIGAAYLDDHEQASLDTFADRLALDLDWSSGLSREELSQRLVRRIRSDFRESKTVRVRGWLLSETEVRWAALVALAPADR